MMMSTQKKKKDGPIKGCLIPLLAVVGLLLVCFLFCTVLFQLNQATGNGGNTTWLTALFG